MKTWQPGKTLEIVEKEVIQQAFKFYNGNKTQTAASLGIAIRTLDSKLEKYEAERIDQETRRENAERRDREFRDRARGDVNAINAAANQQINHQESKENGYGSKKRFSVQPSDEITEKHAMSMSKREEVQELPSKSSASGNTRRNR